MFPYVKILNLGIFNKGCFVNCLYPTTKIPNSCSAWKEIRGKLNYKKILFYFPMCLGFLDLLDFSTFWKSQQCIFQIWSHCSLWWGILSCGAELLHMKLFAPETLSAVSVSVTNMMYGISHIQRHQKEAKVWLSKVEECLMRIVKICNVGNKNPD